MFDCQKNYKNYSTDENQIENLIFSAVHCHYSNSYSKVQHLFAKIWYGHGRTGRTASHSTGVAIAACV